MKNQSYKMELAMVDDQIVPLDEAQINANDRGLFFGDGVYEVLRVCNGRLFVLERHMQRLKNSLDKMDMLAKADLEVIRGRIHQAMQASQLTEALVYFHITRGRAARSHNYSDNWQPNFLLTVRPYQRHSPETARAITHPDWRWKRCDIKSLNLLANVLAKHAAAQAGAYEAILVDEKGLITEATSSSVLLVKDNTLQTAPLTANILPSITRELLVEWAGEIGLKTQEKSFTLAEALQADELIITGTTTEVMGITQLDNRTIAHGQRGQYTRQLRDRLLCAMKE